MTYVLVIVSTAILVLTLPGSVYLLVLTLAGIANKFKNEHNNNLQKINPVTLAIVVPAHNESSHLLVAIESLTACEPTKGNSEIIVVADNCTDDTATVAKNLGCRVLERIDPQRRGKGFALEYAFKSLENEKYDGYVVVDADTRCEANFLVEVEKHLGSGEHVIQVPYLVDQANKSTYARIVDIGFRAFNYLRPLGRKHLGLSAGIFGTGFAVSKEVLQKVPYNAYSIVEDLEYHVNLVRAGFFCKFAPETAVYSAMPESSESSETQRSRWEGGRLRTITEKSIPLAKEICKGKLRLIDPLLELMLLPLWMHVSLLTIALMMPVPIVQTYAIVSISAVAVHVVAAILITGGGVRELRVFFLVPRYVVWKLSISGEIAARVRKSANWERTRRD